MIVVKLELLKIEKLLIVILRIKIAKYQTIVLITEKLKNKIIKGLYKKIPDYIKNFFKFKDKIYNIKIKIKYKFIDISDFIIIDSIRYYIVLGNEQKISIRLMIKKNRIELLLNL